MVTSPATRSAGNLLVRGTGVWIHINRMSGFKLGLLQRVGSIPISMIGGGGTLAVAYFRGYKSMLVGDITATASPSGALENNFHKDHQGYDKFIPSMITTLYEEPDGHHDYIQFELLI